MKIEYININTPYSQVEEYQQSLVEKVIKGSEEHLLFCEHSAIYTLGTSAKKEDILGTFKNIPSIKTGRGGQVTYHGKGQRVIYPILNLNKREKDLRKYIQNLQKWLINSLKRLGVEAYTRDEIGVWVDVKSKPKKIAAIGVRVRKWVTFHGVALNISPNLAHFNGIIPCGITEFGVTSLQELDKPTDFNKIDKILLEEFNKIFN